MSLRTPPQAAFLSLFLVLALIVAPVSPTAAQDEDSSLDYIRAAAAHIPADVEFFAAAQTGSDSIAALDSVLARVADRLALNDPLSVARMIGLFGETSPTVARLNLILPFMESAAVAVHRAEGYLDSARFGDQGRALYVVAFSSAMSAVRAAAPVLFGDATRETQGEYEVYQLVDDDALVALGADHLIFAQGETDALRPDRALADDARFQAALAELPRDDYGLFAYGAVHQVLPLIRDRLTAELLRSLSFGNQTDIALGLAAVSMEGELNLLADAVQTAATAAPLPTLRPDFARYVPADTAFVVQSASIGALIRTAAALYASISAVETQESALALMEGFSQEVLKLSLERDLIPALTSDYLLAVDYRAVDLLPGVSSAVFPVELAVFMEADSPGNAARVVESLYSGVRLFLQDRPYARFREADTSVQIGKLDVVFGAQDRVAYFGTRAFTQEGLAGRAPLSETAEYRAMTAQALDGGHALAYISRRGIGELLLLSGQFDAGSLIPLPLDLLPLPAINPARLYQLADGGLFSVSSTPSGARVTRLALRMR
ncbi:MAG: hypothetical protein IPK19_15425 [Chloroflexi bacterium]|nr:hypothetical protein [Chloroflexota bacterium]